MASLPLLAAQVALVGVLATAFMDAWVLVLRRLGVPTLDFALVGRWIGHGVRRGQWLHAPIAKASPVRGERALGWLVHYGVGIAFAAMLVALRGADWLANPTVLPALAFGIASVAAPWFVMQPAMGAGIASSKTPTPWKNRARSLANHTVFGIGLYLAAIVL
jgi:hypothetical protein